MLLRIGPRAVDAPCVDRDPPSDQLWLRGRRTRAKRHVRFAGCEIEPAIGRDQFQSQAGIGVAEFPQRAHEQRADRDLAARESNRSGETTLMSRGSRTEHAGRRLNLFGGLDERGAGLCRHVARLALVEELHPDRLFERGDAPSCRALTDLECCRRLERGACTRHGEEIFEVVPVEHPAFCISAECTRKLGVCSEIRGRVDEARRFQASSQSR